MSKFPFPGLAGPITSAATMGVWVGIALSGCQEGQTWPLLSQCRWLLGEGSAGLPPPSRPARGREGARQARGGDDCPGTQVGRGHGVAAVSVRGLSPWLLHHCFSNDFARVVGAWWLVLVMSKHRNPSLRKFMYVDMDQ